MTDEEIRGAAVAGIADALRKSPVVFGLALLLGLEALAIAGLAWSALERGGVERERVAALTAQLVECHRNRP